MGASNDNLEAIRTLDPLAAPGITVFMGASTGNMLVDNPEPLAGIFREAPTPILPHCEDTPMLEAPLAQYRAPYGHDITPHCHPALLTREARLHSHTPALDGAPTHRT